MDVCIQMDRFFYLSFLSNQYARIENPEFLKSVVSKKTPINKDSAEPIYVQIASWITSQISTGIWQSGHKLPSEPDLAKELGVSRGSVRKAISILVSKKMLAQVHGRGTFVCEPLLEQSWASRLVSTSEELDLRGIPFTTEVIAQGIVESPEERITNILQLQSGERVLHLLRRRFINDEPLVVHETFFPAARYADILKVDFTVNTMVRDVLEQMYKLRLSRVNHTISAISADVEVSNWLGIAVGQPVLFNEHLLYDINDQIIEFSRGWFRGDKMQLTTIAYRE